jgi:hypothetical protein
MCFNEIPSHVFVRVLDNLLFNFQRPMPPPEASSVPATFPFYHVLSPLSIPFFTFFKVFSGFSQVFSCFFPWPPPAKLVRLLGCSRSISPFFRFVKHNRHIFCPLFPFLPRFFRECRQRLRFLHYVICRPDGENCSFLAEKPEKSLKF